MRSIGVAIPHDDPGVVDELVHAVEAVPDLYLAMDRSKAAVVVAGTGALDGLGPEQRGAGVAVVGLAVDGDLAAVARGALRCAAEDLLCWPADRPSFRSVVRDAASRARLAAGAADGRIVAVVGARGGAGATTVAAMLARGIEGSAVVDLDLLGGGQSGFLPPDVEPTLTQVLGAVEDLDPSGLRSGFVAHASGRALCAPPRTPAADRGAVERLISLLRATVPFAVVDAGRAADAGSRRAVSSADVVVCVCAPDVQSMRGARAFAAENGGARIALNIASRLRLSARDVGRVMGSPPDLVIPADPAVRRAGEAGRLPTKGPARKALGRFAVTLAGEPVREI